MRPKSSTSGTSTSKSSSEGTASSAGRLFASSCARRRDLWPQDCGEGAPPGCRIPRPNPSRTSSSLGDGVRGAAVPGAHRGVHDDDERLRGLRNDGGYVERDLLPRRVPKLRCPERAPKPRVPKLWALETLPRRHRRRSVGYVGAAARPPRLCPCPHHTATGLRFGRVGAFSASCAPPRPASAWHAGRETFRADRPGPRRSCRILAGERSGKTSCKEHALQ